MIMWLIRLGLSDRAARAVRAALAVIPAALLLWAAIARLRADAYRDGTRDTDAKWNAASERLKQQAAVSAGRADVNAARRATEFTARLAEEKEKVDEAVENGADPFDQLFPASVR